MQTCNGLAIKIGQLWINAGSKRQGGLVMIKSSIWCVQANCVISCIFLENDDSQYMFVKILF